MNTEGIAKRHTPVCLPRRCGIAVIRLVSAKGPLTIKDIYSYGFGVMVGSDVVGLGPTALTERSLNCE